MVQHILDSDSDGTEDLQVVAHSTEDTKQIMDAQEIGEIQDIQIIEDTGTKTGENPTSMEYLRS